MVQEHKFGILATFGHNKALFSSRAEDYKAGIVIFIAITPDLHVYLVHPTHAKQIASYDSKHERTAPNEKLPDLPDNIFKKRPRNPGPTKGKGGTKNDFERDENEEGSHDEDDADGPMRPCTCSGKN